jgi:endonuclease YncB( thermonuclease family)
VFLLDGTHVNQTLVKGGWCWWYRKYAPGDTVLEGLEKEARDAKKGLWADPSPIPPWVYRKARCWPLMLSTLRLVCESAIHALRWVING